LDKRVLLISYLFPPTGGAGVQRNLKYAKYLPDFGWQPTILTVKDINYYLYDHSLLSELPAQVQVLRTESLDPLRVSNVLLGTSQKAVSPQDTEKQGAVRNRRFTEASRAVEIYRRVRDVAAFPDSTLGWLPFAYSAGVRAIRQSKVQVTVASIGPVTSAIIAHLLWKRIGVPYVLDFRDGWLDDPYAIRPTKLHWAGHRFLEKKIVGNAHFVTVYDDYLEQRLVERYPQLAGRTAVLPNGFDPSDLNDIVPAAREDKGRIVYTGNLYGHHEANFLTLLGALKQLPPSVLQNLEVLFVGQTYAGAAQRVEEAGLSTIVKFTGYVSHGESLGYLMSADATLLFIRAGDVSSLTGKVFEYIMVGKPIIASLEPHGACGQLLRGAGLGEWISAPQDSATLAQTIAALHQKEWPSPPQENNDRFNRRYNTQRLAGILDELVDKTSASVKQ
jgi:glycosyltransferase involved in cell wall biosynthesis